MFIKPSDNFAKPSKSKKFYVLVKKEMQFYSHVLVVVQAP